MGADPLGCNVPAEHEPTFLTDEQVAALVAEHEAQRDDCPDDPFC